MKKFILKLRALLSIVLIMGMNPIKAQNEYPYFNAFIARVLELIPNTHSPKAQPTQKPVSYTQLARRAKAEARRSRAERVGIPTSAPDMPMPEAVPNEAPEAAPAPQAPMPAQPQPQKPVAAPAQPVQNQDDLKSVLVHLEEYVRNVYGCMVNFMDKDNTQKCPAHAQEFEQYLEILKTKVIDPLKKMSNNPLARKIEVVAHELDRSQHKMDLILNAGYNSATLIAKLQQLNAEVYKKNRHLITHTLPEIGRLIQRSAPELSAIFNKIATQINELTEYNPGAINAMRALMKRA